MVNVKLLIGGSIAILGGSVVLRYVIFPTLDRSKRSKQIAEAEFLLESRRKAKEQSEQNS